MALAGYECGVKNNIRASISASSTELLLYFDGSKTAKFKGAVKAAVYLLIVLEISISLFIAYLGWWWVVNPNGNFEPKLALTGVVLGLLELIRRYLPKN